MDKPTDDTINPHYYQQGGMQHFEVVVAFGLDYFLGQCTKYLFRAGKKNPEKELEDLTKAKWYLDKKIALLTAEIENES